MFSLLMAVLVAPPRPSLDLYRYLQKHDRSYQYHLVSQNGNRSELSMVSQTWQGIKWNHTILLQRPSKIKHKHLGILYITGDGPRKGDLLDLALATQASGLPVAMLFDIPNQPIEGHREDDLIAYTFEKYLENPDPKLPLLFPMTKSAIRAMDTIQKFTRRTSDPIDEFVVVGASKRGWTTWLVGAAGDRRVKAIVPMVFDNLNFGAQMHKQMDNWGKYSDQIQDYTDRGLQAQLETPRGMQLESMVDPYSYRRYIREPTLIVKGSNDPYWSADSLDVYWSQLHQPKWVLTVPNAGHTLGDGLMAVETIGAFAQAVAGDFSMPAIDWQYSQDSGSARLVVSSKKQPYTTATLWVAQSDTLDFRPSKYIRYATLDADVNDNVATNEFDFKLGPEKNVAMFAELRFRIDGHEFSLSTPTEVFKKTQ